MNLKRLLLLVALLAGGTAQAASILAPVPDTMEERVKPCVECHRPEGAAGRDAYYPRLAGKPQGYLFNQLLNFREGRRHYRPMAVLIEYLSDDYLREMAGHFADLNVTYPPPQRSAEPAVVSARARVLVTMGDPSRNIPACIACHGRDLMGVAPYIPGLLGLPRDYIAAQFGAWRTGLRRAQSPDCMGEIARRFSGAELTALAAWLATQPVPQNARPVATLPAPLPLRCGSVAVEGSRP